MVSPISARLLTGDYSSSNSNSSNGSFRSKRPSSSMRRKSRKNDSVSGYSADKEESSNSTLTPPMVSIDLYAGSKRSNMSNMHSCPKRRKNCERQFAASSVRADLARAGMMYPELPTEKTFTTRVGGHSINLDGVRLVRSKDFDPLQPTCNFPCEQTMSYYQDLINQTLKTYTAFMSREKEMMQAQDSDSGSTYSMSDTETDSVTSSPRSSTPVFVLPLRLDDVTKERSTDSSSKRSTLDTCHVISSHASAITMTDMLQLSRTPRLIVTSLEPHTIMYANAPFFRLTGLPNQDVVGSSFSKILQSANGGKSTPLSECLCSSGAYHHRTLKIPISDSETSDYKLKVSPIVKELGASTEVANVSCFAIEILDDENDSTNSSLESSVSNAPRDTQRRVEIVG
eukprot:CAMPEP_0198120322 /NCGR_PEP_ID=MMETSP1442-20131203/28648_1 /TAXON_ID= /ORGANISM="Craspedostauros australis, Strain CCMP3328" /LENGTH=398 /DNA_ID=CAMNT_0043778955 /DNA_START=204 /DNA_END=1400 /DNA_ORIENTATION=+